jgi:hypothetical protein
VVPFNKLAVAEVEVENSPNNEAKLDGEEEEVDEEDVRDKVTAAVELTSANELSTINTTGYLANVALEVTPDGCCAKSNCVAILPTDTGTIVFAEANGLTNVDDVDDNDEDNDAGIEEEEDNNDGALTIDTAKLQLELI